MNTPIRGNGNPEDILSIADKHFDRMLRQVNELITTLESENTVTSNEATLRIRNLGKAIQTFFEERAKVEKLNKHTAGIVHDYALDFDAARVEIGRRLACLRAAQGAAGVSG